jgi:predicted ATPase
MSGELQKGDVKIEINPRANRKKFFDLLDEIYAGSDIYRRRDQLQKICLSTTPMELVDLILNKNKDKLVESCGITEDTAGKIVRTPGYEELHQIQVCLLQDELAVYLRKAKGEDFSPLKDLSYGEKCTAIFSIALLGKKKPLLVDQPEDELDHAFVIDNIVEHIRGVKEKRQLLVSTHNANIPVLGDAELILKVTKVPGEDKCTVEEKGAFEKESIIGKLQDLEGGPEAFRRRREKYGI